MAEGHGGSNMVQLDHQLIYAVRRLTTGANIHRVRELVFLYNQAVDLHTRQWPSHIKYQQNYERDLRAFVTAAGWRKSRAS
jgi:hypothetical protein